MDFDEVAFLNKRGVTLYLDVGANIGQTAQRLRKAGWRGRIHSFEPIPLCFSVLAEKAAADADWQAENIALGDVEGRASIGISENYVSSSLREASDLLVAIHEPVRYMASAEIAVKRLDTILPTLLRDGDVAHLKIDTQGFERNVIEGAAASLSRIDSVRMEVAVSEVYTGEMLLPEAISMMTGKGFVLIEAWPAWRHPRTREVLHFDLLFRQGAIAI